MALFDKPIRIGTRGSKLALWQAYHVEEKLKAAGLETEIVIFTTKGDKILDVSLSKIGSKGVFTEELEEALRDGGIDIAVHSAKDVQSSLADDLELLAFLERENPSDVVLSFDPTFSLNRENIVVGTSSTRRRALLKKYYPHVKTVEARGNLQTRLQKMEEKQFDGMLLAYAGVHRMDYVKWITQTLSLDQFIPAVGQGSVAVESARNLDVAKREKLKAILNHEETAYCLKTERAFLRTMEGGCSIPSFALASLHDGKISITGGIISLDGQQMIKETFSGAAAEAESLGQKLAETVLEKGGKEILADIRAQQKQL
ncbi:hydroxymethylbilane synthase [Adhaeribacter sp. BT258]|uniref:Porphobilinogen deaminase n=1 Tax=Adhaeribacter terrigena TaxID=2793070 RepID=A0ABS1BWS2_9BACT|nr:hydroxymethylbilane synthase [Adhaeribacter terrigena]MBK0401522.1 hydroxymethylbilane synthase [Adhaeribacter terrigena]